MSTLSRTCRLRNNLASLSILMIAFGACPADGVELDPPVSVKAHSAHHTGHAMTVDASGTVMNSNTDNLPTECASISRDYEFEVFASVEYARAYPGNVFGMSQYQYQVEPCSRITVTFFNRDQIRHQWMVHGLPNYLYPGGMFHLEAAGGHRQIGTFIVPGADRTYLVHCDMAQHMEKGMKGQLVVGKGSGNLWAVPGVSSNFNSDAYNLPNPGWLKMMFLAIGALSGIWFLRSGKAKVS